jgi:hypothetical protein
MKSLLSIAVAITFAASNWAALTCGIDCEHRTQSATEHSTSLSSLHSLHVLHAEPAHNHSGDPILQPGRHSCGTHVGSQAVVSLKRIVRMDEVTLPGEASPQFLRTTLPDAGAHFELPWRLSLPLFEPHPVSLRI